jgi:hypothetical protein
MGRTMRILLAVDVDKNEPTLTFNVSMIPEEYEGPGDVFETLLGEKEEVPILILQVYRVTQLGHGSHAKLVSKHLKSLPLPTHGQTRGISLRGPHFARIFPSLGGGNKIEVYDWTRCEASAYVKPLIIYTHRLPVSHPPESNPLALMKFLDWSVHPSGFQIARHQSP